MSEIIFVTAQMFSLNKISDDTDITTPLLTPVRQTGCYSIRLQVVQEKEISDFKTSLVDSKIYVSKKGSSPYFEPRQKIFEFLVSVKLFELTQV